MIPVGVLAAVTGLIVTSVGGFRVPSDLRAVWWWGSAPDVGASIHSPLTIDFLSVFQDNSSVLAYYPLLVLSTFSFLLNRRSGTWAWGLPWALLATISILEARTIPFFAVLAGPAMALNVQDFFARRAPSPPRRGVFSFGFTFGSVVVAAFLVAAWPGWLQGPPYEPRRWAVEMPSAHEWGADLLRRSHAGGVWPAGTRTLHVSPETFGTFAWQCPEDGRTLDEGVVTSWLTAERVELARARLRELKVNRVVVAAGDSNPTSRAILDRFFSDPDEWRVLTVRGGVVVFGWNDSASRPDSTPYAGWEVDFWRLAFRPVESEMAPATGPPAPRHWSSALWVPAYPTRPPGRDEATALLMRAEAARPSAPYRHLGEWEAGQVAGLVASGGAGIGPAFGADIAVRLILFRPPLPRGDGDPILPQTEWAFTIQQRFAADRGAIPIGDVYAAIRAARRAVAENPNDANAYYILAQTYSTLANATAENRWSGRDGIPQLRRVRQIQASAAYNRAVALNPRLASAHRELSLLYRTIGCLDLAVDHLRAYQSVSPRWGGPSSVGPAAEELTAERKYLEKALGERTRTFETDSAKLSVSDRALLAVQLELGGLALSLLLKSDVSAFGAQGVELEADLLLRTGRPHDVLDWITPEVRGSLGDQKYHWSRAQCHLAIGDYDSADRELGEMVGPDGRGTLPFAVGTEVAAVVGKGILDAQPSGGSLHDVVMHVLSRADMQRRIAETAQSLGLQSNMVALRGMAALEAGNVTRARQHFQSALTFSPHRWGGGQLEFSGRRAARHALGRLDDRP